MHEKELAKATKRQTCIRHQGEMHEPRDSWQGFSLTHNTEFHDCLWKRELDLCRFVQTLRSTCYILCKGTFFECY